MSRYAFIDTLLPTLRVGQAPEIDSYELDFIMKLNLKKSDFEEISHIRRLVDIDNILALASGTQFLPGGNLNEGQLQEALISDGQLPSWIMSFLETYPQDQERVAHFPELYHTFFQKEKETTTGFLKTYFEFEWQWRLVMLSLRAKELGRDLAKELKYEDPEDDFVNELLSQREGKGFEAPLAMQPLQAIYKRKKDSPLDLLQAISEWRFETIDDLISWKVLSLEYILGYVAKLQIVEQWLFLDRLKGEEELKKLAKTALP